jgi:hypothetical protein
LRKGREKIRTSVEKDEGQTALLEHPPTYRKREAHTSISKMRVDEVNTDLSLMARLITAQFPQWADLLIQPVQSAGTDNALYNRHRS